MRMERALLLLEGQSAYMTLEGSNTVVCGQAVKQPKYRCNMVRHIDMLLLVYLARAGAWRANGAWCADAILASTIWADGAVRPTK
jgi:hypothetical protein